MKIVRIAGLHYDSLIAYLDRRSIGLTYRQKQNLLFDQAYAYSNFFSRAMVRLGHDAQELNFDWLSLQKSWAKERGISFKNRNWQEEILIAQLKEIKPEVVYFQDIFALSYEAKKNLKKIVPSIRLIVIFRGYPGTNETLFKELSTADLLLVGSPVLQKKCEEKGLAAHLVYHFFDETILEKITQQATSYDFTFTGSSGIGFGLNHYLRYLFLSELMERSCLEIWAFEKKLEWKQALRNSAMKILEKIPPPKNLIKLTPPKIRRLFKEIEERRAFALKHNQKYLSFIPLEKRFPQKTHPSLFGLDMYQLLSQSKITFNKHSNPANGYVDNIRLFQATGVGACLLTDDGANMSDLFVKDEEIVTYSSLDECVEKVDFLLNNETVRKKIALKGQKRTLSQHTALHRCREIAQLLEKELTK